MSEMTPQDLFHARLRQLLEAPIDQDTWFALWPVRTRDGERVWLRWVNYERKLYYDGQVLEPRTTYWVE
jgi:hypothetical protein